MRPGLSVVAALAAAALAASVPADDAKEIAKLTRQLSKEKDHAKRAEAAERLGDLRAAAATPALSAALRDAHPAVREAAAGALWEMHEMPEAKAALPALEEAAAGEADLDVLVDLTGALRALDGDPSKYVPALRRIHDQAKGCGGRMYAAKALWGYGPSADLLPAVLQCVADADADAARDADRLLSRIVKARDAAAAVEGLAAAVAEGRRARAREAAARALASIGVRAQPALAALKQCAEGDADAGAREACRKAVLDVEVRSE
jgi:hypothetical protein